MEKLEKKFRLKKKIKNIQYYWKKNFGVKKRAEKISTIVGIIIIKNFVNRNWISPSE